MLDNSLYVDDLISRSDLDDKFFYLSSSASESLKEAGMNEKISVNYLKI